jgi:Cys-tRNA(Pro)/Cys-tRNA(Cys) deacylase
MKTNAARILDQLGIHYRLVEYPVDVDDLSAEKVAREIGMPLDQVWKTLVCRGDKLGVLLAVIPASTTLDLRALARVSGDKRVDTVPLKEVQPLTGYVRGGVTALGAKKPYPTFVDETIELFEEISVSAGVRGTQIVLAPADYVRATGAKLGAIT